MIKQITTQEIDEIINWINERRLVKVKEKLRSLPDFNKVYNNKVKSDA